MAITTDTDKVRLLIGDRDSSDYLLDADEVAYALTVESDVTRAAVLCCQYIVSKYSRYVDNRRGRTWERATQLVAQYKDLRKSLLANSPVTSKSLYAGGITKSDKDIYESDTDLVGPMFKRGMHDATEIKLNDEVAPDE